MLNDVRSETDSTAESTDTTKNVLQEKNIFTANTWLVLRL